MELGIKGKRALVTGASGGLGRAVAKALAAEGARVIAVSRRLDVLKGLCAELGEGHLPMAADLSQEGSGTRLAEQILAEVGAPEIIVHNVGGSLQVKDPLAAAADWRRVFQLNLGSAIELNAALLPELQRRKWGRVVHVSSIGALNFTGYAAYCCAKAAVNGYVKSVAQHLAKDNVILSAVLPGPLRIEGRFLEKMEKSDPGAWAQYVQHHLPIGRLAALEEIAPAIAFLCSERASYAPGSLVDLGGANH